MAPPTLIVAQPPSLRGYRRARTAAVGRVDFGDGYAQRQAAGPVEVTAAVVWPALPAAAAAALVAFLEARRGAEAFYYTLDPDLGAELWSCADFEEAWATDDRVTVSATLRRERDLI